MDRAEDQRRYFIFASAVYEVVIPLLKQRLETHYRGLGCPDFKAFLNHQPSLHILFHLQHRNGRCCFDVANCTNRQNPPMFYDQWNQLYTNSTNPKCTRLCHCNFMANEVDLNDIDLTLVSLILINVCGLPPNEIGVVKNLRRFKNKHLSHNSNGCIKKNIFGILWADLMTNILQLDVTKKDDLLRIQNRPLDASLCNRYRIEFNDIQTKLNEMDKKIDSIHQMMLTNTTITKNNRVDDTKPTPPYILGQDIFCPHYTEIDLNSFTLLPQYEGIGLTSDILMTDDGKIVMCQNAFDYHFLLICNSDGSSEYGMHMEGLTLCVTTISDSIVAVTLPNRMKVVVCDINERVILKTIEMPNECFGIALINNILAVGGNGKIWLLDYQTGKITNTIKTDGMNHWILHTSGNKIASINRSTYNLTFYDMSGETLFSTNTITSPKPIIRITSLHDESLYVLCNDNRVYHVSSDGQRYKLVQTEGIDKMGMFLCGGLYFNQRKQKLILCENSTVKIFHVV